MNARLVLALVALGTSVVAAQSAARAEVRAWEAPITIPTYAWEEDINPKFWALEGEVRPGAPVAVPIVYPYVMQDHLLRSKADRTYKALFLENEYLRVACLPELGGRLHSVLDKTEGKEMFHLNRVIKPGMIAMRGAWISGGVEWNSGPHGHTVAVLSPVDALTGRNPDGSAYLEISNQEQIFRTRWTVRVTLHPGRAYLDEQIRLENPTDGMHPYYFWNCTAFPNRPGTRFIYPMTLGTDHNAREFFRWPVDKGRDLSWLKNYETYQSIFAVDCSQDFFGAYDVDSNRGIVQVANHHELGGKKAWTWGEWDFGKVAEKNLTDEDGPYIEVQSGPLPTQSDYGMLAPHDRVAWQEYWYPVHGLGDGFEYATRDLAVQTSRRAGRLELRLLATACFPQALCILKRGGRELARKQLDLAPAAPAVVTLVEESQKPVQVAVTDAKGKLLAAFTTPLPIAKVNPPDPARFVEKPDDKLTVEELYLKGRKLDRATQRRDARQSYEKALQRDPGHVDSLRALAVLDFEAGLYNRAIPRLHKALDRDGDDGLSWYYLGACHLRLAAACRPDAFSKPAPDAKWRGHLDEAVRCAYRSVRCPGTESIGYDLAGRAMMNQGNPARAAAAFEKAVRSSGTDPFARDHRMLALRAAGLSSRAIAMAKLRLAENPTAIVPRAMLALADANSLAQFAGQGCKILGDADFEILDAGLALADLGLFREADQLVQAVCVDAAPPSQRSFLPLYHLAWYSAQSGDPAAAQKWLGQAAATRKDRVFASRTEELDILRFAIRQSPADAQALLQLGCLLANLGRVDEAVSTWQRAAELSPNSSIAWRNLALAAAAKNEPAKAEGLYRKAIAARPDDQTLYRDLARLLVAAGRRAEAIRLVETMPPAGMRRAEITVLLAQAYVDQERFEDCIKLLESIPYFVNWEGQDLTWRLFNRAHVERGRQRLARGDAKAALADFEAALTYPANLNVGRSNKPEEAPAQYWRGQALMRLARADEARQAWQAAAAGADVPGTQNEYRQKARQALQGAKK